MIANQVASIVKRLRNLGSKNAQPGRLDTFITSYPRSGNGWVAVLVADVVLQLQGIKTGTQLPFHIHEIIARGPDTLSEIHPDIKLPFHLIKSHVFYDAMLDHPIIYVFRQPGDCLASYYYFTHSQGQDESSGQTINQFVVEHFPEWQHHIEKAIGMKTKQNKQDILFVSYETLYYDQETGLEVILNFLGLDATEQMIQRAIHNHTFEKQKAAIDNKLSHYYNKNTVGGYLDELSPETLEIIQARSNPSYEAAQAISREYPSAVDSSSLSLT